MMEQIARAGRGPLTAAKSRAGLGRRAAPTHRLLLCPCTCMRIDSTPQCVHMVFATLCAQHPRQLQLQSPSLDRSVFHCSAAARHMWTGPRCMFPPSRTMVVPMRAVLRNTEACNSDQSSPHIEGAEDCTVCAHVCWARKRGCHWPRSYRLVR